MRDQTTIGRDTFDEKQRLIHHRGTRSNGINTPVTRTTLGKIPDSSNGAGGVTVVASQDLQAGTPVTIMSNGEIKAADIDPVTGGQCDGFVTEDVTTGDSVAIVSSGLITAEWLASNMTVGDTVWLSSAPDTLSNNPPAVLQERIVQKLGVATGQKELYIAIGEAAKIELE